ncbi:hypothetical protein [Methylocapsa sp. S129]|uniref:hypothetical protein n=1 Tax=Methylocapsa sp. S129 TaxID=1641869 RepID=UPI00131E360A|nr:hypothetical protein [Methylocapsa sp. S129]
MRTLVLGALAVFSVQAAMAGQVKHRLCAPAHLFVRCVIDPASLPANAPAASCDYNGGGDPSNRCLCPPMPGVAAQSGHVRCSEF